MNNLNCNSNRPHQPMLQQPVVIVPVNGQQAVPRPDVQTNIVVPTPNNWQQNHQIIVMQPYSQVRIDIPLSQQGPNINPNQIQYARVPQRDPQQLNRLLQNDQIVVEQPNQREVRLDIPLSQQGPHLNHNQIQNARVPQRDPQQLNRQPLSKQGQGGLF